MIQLLFVFSDFALLILRVIVGIIFISHGWPKISDLRGTASWFSSAGFKPGNFWATFIAILEFVGGLFLIVGFFVQVLGLLFAIEMLVAFLVVNRKRGLVGGYELDIILFAASLILATMGGGILTLDEFLGIRLY